MARVQADDETWTTFRALVGPRPISKVLGDLVCEEVRRFRSEQLREQALEPHELLEALERAREQQADLETLVRRLEALHGLLTGRSGSQHMETGVRASPPS